MMNLVRFSSPASGKLIFLLLLTAVFAAGCTSSAESKQTEKSGGETEKNNAAPVKVTTGKAEAREIPIYFAVTGSLAADETSDVAPKTAGKVVRTFVDVGAFVRQGDVIAKLDDADSLLQLREAKSGVVQAQSNVVQAQAGVAQAQARLGLSGNGSFQSSTIPEVRAANANLEQFQAELKQAEANENRYRDLVQTGDVSSQVYEGYRTARDTARARVNNARQQLEAAVNAAKQNNQAVKSAQAAVEAARTGVAIAQTGVATAEQAVGDTTIRAPFSGFVSARNVAIGESVTPATPLITLVRTNPLRMQLQVPEANVPLITMGMGVSLEVEAFKDRKFAGTVTAINPSLDAASRSATIEAAVQNPDNSLRPGMFATAKIARENGGKGVFVPRAAILADQNTESYRVFVIQENIAKLRVVQIGTEENDATQIVSGINADEIVATANLGQLYEGAKVEF